MSQATLGPTPYNNSNLFSGYYLEERVDDLDTWDCDEEAEAAFEELQRIWELEFELLESYKEDELLSSWIDEVLDVLGFGTLAETTLPEKGGSRFNLQHFINPMTRRTTRLISGSTQKPNPSRHYELPTSRPKRQT